MIFRCGSVFLISARTSRPFTPGILTSRITRPISFALPNNFRAASPSGTSTTSYPSRKSLSSLLSPSSSSTIKILSTMGFLSFLFLRVFF
ncbi:MAG: hypothetical protein WC317_03965 [Candidatus Omnitrophota bacterium]